MQLLQQTLGEADKRRYSKSSVIVRGVIVCE